MQGFEGTSAGSRPLLSDGLGRPTGRRTVSQNPALPVVVDFRYGFDRVGNLTHEQRRHEPLSSPAGTYRTRAFKTDRLGRLAGMREGPLGIDPVLPTAEDPPSLIEAPTAAESWSLDLLGNWQSRTAGPPESEVTDTFTTNALNQYSAVDPEGAGGDPAQPFGFDWLGQMRDNASRNQRYVWDVFGRLTKIENAATGSLIARYRFDAFNRRVEKHAPSAPGTPDATTRYHYDGWRAIEERAVEEWTVEGSPIVVEVVRARYGFGLALDEVLWMDRDVARNSEEPWQPDPISGTPDGTIEARYFVHHDHLGSAVAVTDDPASAASVAVVERFTYSAYGQAAAWEATWSSETGSYPASSSPWLSKVGLPYLYTGQRFDPESGLQYSKHRVYDPAVGKFLRRDLVGYGDGPSLYGYARSHPATWTDPYGLWSASGSSVRHIAINAESRRHVVAARYQAMPTGLFSHPVGFFGDSNDDSKKNSDDSGDSDDSKHPLDKGTDMSRCPSVEACGAVGTYFDMLQAYGPGWTVEIKNEIEAARWERFVLGELSPEEYDRHAPIRDLSPELTGVPADVTVDAAAGRYYWVAVEQGSYPGASDLELYDTISSVTGAWGLGKSGKRVAGVPKVSPKFKPPTNPPQLPPREVPPGWRVREMPPTEQYPHGYWKLEKPMANGGWQPVDPSTMKPGTHPETHVPLPPTVPE